MGGDTTTKWAALLSKLVMIGVAADAERVAAATVATAKAILLNQGRTRQFATVLGVTNMHKTNTPYAITLLALIAAASPIWSQEPNASPTVWMGPPAYENGKCFRELFEHPDAWKETRSAIDVLQFADHQLDRQFTDDELRGWFSQLQQWQLKFALEVGAVKPWGQTGERTFAVQSPKWERFRSLGANLYAIAMDEPLICCRKHIDKPDDYALEETADFIARVRKQYPDMLIGDIETYPSISLEDHYWWIDTLQKRLAEKGVRGLDFYRLDVNWANFVVQDLGCWGDVRKLEEYCRKRKLPFSLIYWASEQPALDRMGLADDSTWYVSIMQQGYDYAMVRGRPDQYAVQSWIDAPSHSVPETAPWTFTRSVLDFSRKFVKRAP